MPLASTILVVLLSCDGYWFGGRTGMVSVQYNIQEEAQSDALFAWTLMHGEVELHAGELQVTAKKDQSSQLLIDLPSVRARTTLKLRYRLFRKADRHELFSGESVIHVFPDSLLEPLAELCRGNPLLVIGRAGDQMVNVLADADIEHHRSDGMTAINGGRIVLVLPRKGSQELTGFEQSSLMTAAQRGASVMIFEQKNVSRLLGYDVVHRLSSTGDLAWRDGHPLLAHMEPKDWRSMIMSRDEYSAVRLPEDDPSLKIVFWPSESDRSDLSASSDALIVSRTMGAGRVVFCQLPLDSLHDDPRQQMLLVNSIEYLFTRPVPQGEPATQVKPGGVE